VTPRSWPTPGVWFLKRFLLWFLMVSGLWCRVWGSGFRVQGSRRGNYEAGFKVQGWGLLRSWPTPGVSFMVNGVWSKVEGLGLRVEGFMVWNLRSRVQGLGLGIQG